MSLGGRRKVARVVGQRSQRWGPLVSALVMLPLLAILPSSLNLPSTDPAETLEYAPVPPEGDENPPPNGNFSTLGLGRGGGVGRATSGSSPEFGEHDARTGGRAVKFPSTKRCVGTPPRQTEDRLSPPCVAHFSGDNFGSTYRGVSRDEVRVMLHVSPFVVAPYGPDTYIDLTKPEQPDESAQLRILRTWQRYFNERYQTYGRFVRFIVFGGSGSTPEQTRAQATANRERVDPFAAISHTNSQQPHYLRAMAREGILGFATSRLPADDYASTPGLIWGHDPSVEQYARLAADYICTQLVPYPVSFSGNPGDLGQPRQLGLYHTSDNRNREIVETWQRLRHYVTKCGGTFVDEQTYSGEAKAVEDPGNTDPGQSRSAQIARAMASFRQNGVTTIIWPGFDQGSTQGAAAQQYRPEWLQVGVGDFEANLWGKLQDQSVWRHAQLFSDIVRENRPQDTPCYYAYFSVAGQDSQRPGTQPGFTEIDSACSRSMGIYPVLMQMFTAIQVAGPRLNPANVEKGFRAIPDVPSHDPFVPACYYEPGDHTCVKDAVIEWWDPSGRAGADAGPSGSSAGCWRMPENGLRHVRGQWPRADAAAVRTPSDPCNGVEQ